MSSFTTSGRSSSMNVNEAGSAPTSSRAIDQPSCRAEVTVLNSSAGREVRARSVISRTTCAVEPLATASACIVRAVPSFISEGSTLRNRLTPRRSCRSAARKAAARHSSSSSARRSDRAAASNRAAGEVSSPDPRTRASYPTTRSDSRSQIGCRTDERPPRPRRSVTCDRVASPTSTPPMRITPPHFLPSCDRALIWTRGGYRHRFAVVETSGRPTDPAPAAARTAGSGTGVDHPGPHESPVDRRLRGQLVPVDQVRPGDSCRGAPERIRTSDSRFRKPLLYPLSYGGGAWIDRPSASATCVEG